jgi:hypothetical protein
MSTSYHRFFAECNVGARFKLGAVMTGLKVTKQQYYNFESYDPSLRYRIDSAAYNTKSVDFLAQSFFHVEPFVHYEGGWPFVALNMQFGASFHADDHAPIGGDSPFYLSFGATFHYAPRFFKKIKEADQKK